MGSGSGSGDGTESANWKKGITKTQQMYIAQKYRAKYDWGSDKPITSIEEKGLRAWKKKPKKACRSL